SEGIHKISQPRILSSKTFKPREDTRKTKPKPDKIIYDLDIKCSNCHIQFPSHKLLIKHEYAYCGVPHSDEKLLEFGFVTRVSQLKSLDQEFLLKRGGTSLFCDICSTSFSNRFSLFRHIKSRHNHVFP